MNKKRCDMCGVNPQIGKVLLDDHGKEIYYICQRCAECAAWVSAEIKAKHCADIPYKAE